MSKTQPLPPVAPAVTDLKDLFDDLIDMTRLGMELSLVAAICGSSWREAVEGLDAEDGDTTLRLLLHFRRHGVQLLTIGAHPTFFRQQVRALAETRAGSWAVARGAEPGLAKSMIVPELWQRYERDLDQDEFRNIYRLGSGSGREVPPPREHPAHDLNWVEEQIQAFVRANSGGAPAIGAGQMTTDQVSGLGQSQA